MTPEERQAFLADNEQKRAALLVDMARREEHRLLYGDPEERVAPPAPQPETAPYVPAYQRAMENYIQQAISGQITALVGSLGDEIGDIVGKLERDLRNEITRLQTQVDQLLAEQRRTKWWRRK